jgi:hypothetical protein
MYMVSLVAVTAFLRSLDVRQASCLTSCILQYSTVD